jgi:hypothetical protein
METYDNTKEGPPNKVEFFILLRGLEDAITEGDLTRFTFDNLKELLGKLFKMSPSASVEDLNDVIDAVDIMITDLQQGLNEIAENAAYADDGRAVARNTFVRPVYANTLTVIMEKIKQYTDQMMRNVYRSEKDKVTLSKSLIKSLSFDRLLRTRTADGAVGDIRRLDRRLDQAAEDFDEGDEDGRPYALAQPRENEEQAGVPRQPLAGRNGDPERDRFGARNGAFAAAPAYFEQPGFVAPLALAGVEQVGVPQQRTPAALVDAAEAAVAFILDPQRTDANRDLSEEELITALYPMPNNFVTEVTDRLEEQGFTPEEISYGVSGLPISDVFAEYIMENTQPADVYDEVI